MCEATSGATLARCARPVAASNAHRGSWWELVLGLLLGVCTRRRELSSLSGRKGGMCKAAGGATFACCTRPVAACNARRGSWGERKLGMLLVLTRRRELRKFSVIRTAGGRSESGGGDGDSEAQPVSVADHGGRDGGAGDHGGQRHGTVDRIGASIQAGEHPEALDLAKR